MSHQNIFQSQIEDECAERPEPEVKLRNSFSETHVEEVLQQMSCYSVGMVMRHKRYNYYCVIFGWDPICKATLVSFQKLGISDSILVNPKCVFSAMDSSNGSQ